MSKTTRVNKTQKAKLAVEAPVKTGRKAKLEKDIPAKTDVEAVTKTEAVPASEQPEEAKEVSTKIKTAKVRSLRYQKAKKLIDVNKLYSPAQATKLVKLASLSKFSGKIEAHLVVTEIGNLADIVFPHFETAAKKIVILNDSILGQIKAGQIDFDVLIATPATMPKLLPFAKTLGPKGLMPNPKNGTLTDKPEEAVKRLSVAKTSIKTEKKAPLVHQIIGLVSQPEKEIEANLLALIKAIKPARIKKLIICPTMGPSIKVEVQK